MGDTYKVRETIDWFKKLDGKDFRLITESKDLYIPIHLNQLPHLLGLQYMNNDDRKGMALIREVERKEYSDLDIIKKIKASNPQMVKSVKERIATFKEFLENIDRATLMGRGTNIDTFTNIRSNYFVIDIENNNYRHLGIAEDRDECRFMDIDTTYIMETYFSRSNDKYTQGTTLQEKIQDILEYDYDKEEWVKSSFDLGKALYLRDMEQGINDKDLLKYICSKDIVKSYEFNNFNFVPIRKFYEDEVNDIMKKLKSDALFNKDFSVNKFYREIDVEEDIFLCIENGELYIPATNGLFLYDIGEESKETEIKAYLSNNTFLKDMKQVWDNQVQNQKDEEKMEEDEELEI